MKTLLRILLALIVIIVIAGAGVWYLSQEEATVPIEQTYGPDPALAEPNPTLIPTINVAKAEPWPAGVLPKVAEGMVVNEFAGGLDHPRWLHVLPNGDVLVAESNAPPKPDEGFSIRGLFMSLFMSQAGAQTKSADRISLLRDADGDGLAETKTVFLSGLYSPFGMTFSGGKLYVANADAIVAFRYEEGATEITAALEKIVALPAGRNRHRTKDVIASADGTKLYATVGSNSNVGENGMAEEEGRAAVHEIDLATGEMRLFASGLRNTNGLSWQPDSGALWVVVNERDEIGSDLVPDYMTSVRTGRFMGGRTAIRGSMWMCGWSRSWWRRR